MILSVVLVIYGFLIKRLLVLVKPKRRWLPLKDASFEILGIFKNTERYSDSEKQAILLFNAKTVFLSSIFFFFLFLIMLLPYFLGILLFNFNTKNFYLFSLILITTGYFLGYLYDRQIQ